MSFSTFWYVRSDKAVVGPYLDCYTDIGCWGANYSPKKAIKKHRLPLQYPEDVEYAKALLCNANHTNVRAIQVKISKRGKETEIK